MKKILVLGIGNILQSDDGIGVHVANEILSSGRTISDDVEIIDGGTAGLDLIPIMIGREKIIIIDALKAEDEPGSIYRFKPDHAVQARRMLSLHEGGITDVLNTMRLMGHTPEVEIIGIVPEDITTLDIALSEAVRKSMPRAIDIVLNAATI